MRLGYDIEYAVFNPQGKCVPAGVLPIVGLKGNPEPLADGGLEIDCCAVEITPPPAVTEDEFVGNITNLLMALKAKFPEYRFATTPSQYFDRRVLMRTKHAMTMGCEPDFNAWTGQENPKPEPEAGLRSFGGHIHIEGGNENTVKACDMVLGMYSVIEDRDTNRRKLYGRAGAFRYKPYGVEYRVLSNFWTDKQDYMRKIYKLTRHAQALAYQDKVDSLVTEFGGPDVIQAVINESNVEQARYMYETALAA